MARHKPPGSRKPSLCIFFHLLYISNDDLSWVICILQQSTLQLELQGAKVCAYQPLQYVMGAAQVTNVMKGLNPTVDYMPLPFWAKCTPLDCKNRAKPSSMMTHLLEERSSFHSIAGAALRGLEFTVCDGSSTSDKRHEGLNPTTEQHDDSPIGSKGDRWRQWPE